MAVRNIGMNCRSITGRQGLSGLQFESALERDLLDLLKFDLRIEYYETQPLTLYYEAESKKVLPYTPDVLVHYHQHPSMAEALCPLLAAAYRVRDHSPWPKTDEGHDQLLLAADIWLRSLKPGTVTRLLAERDRMIFLMMKNTNWPVAKILETTLPEISPMLERNDLTFGAVTEAEPGGADVQQKRKRRLEQAGPVWPDCWQNHGQWRRRQSGAN